MVSTYLSSKKIIDSLLANSKFVNLAKILVNSDKGTPTYLETYDALNALLISLGITERLVIQKSDGITWYSNLYKPDELFNESYNTRPDIFSAINYAFGNPICNKKLYPLELQSSICSGYGFATRAGNERSVTIEITAKTYKPSSNPLSTDVFTLRVVQDV
jgi:hypothetical protein